MLHEPRGPYPNSQYEHSSIPATVKKIFNLKEFLTERDAWAGTFDNVITRKSPRIDCPLTLPEPEKMKGVASAGEEGKLTEFQAALVQLAAVLKGDHIKEEKLQSSVEEKTVQEGAKYLQDAFQAFCSAGEVCRKQGMDESQIIEVTKATGDKREAKKKPFLKRMIFCFSCVKLSTANEGPNPGASP